MSFEALVENQVVGDYRLVKRIGAGGFGEVWLAEHEVLKSRPAALKFPTAETAVAALKNEGKMQHSLDHPAIVRILGLSLRHDPPYVAMEYISGGSLEERLQRGPLGPRETLDIFRQFLDALEFAHEHDVVHHDLKPSNLLLDQEGRVFVSDFGLSSVFSAKELVRSASLTHSLSPAGSFEYMSPEKRRGSLGGPSSDIYSAGVILYRCLTGVLPDGLLAPGELRPELGTAFDSLAKRCLHPDPARRIESAAALRAELEEAVELCEGGPKEAPKPRRWISRRAWRGIVVTLLLSLWVDYHYRPFGRWTLLGRYGRPTMEELVLDLGSAAFDGFDRIVLLPTVSTASGESNPSTRRIDDWLVESAFAGRPSVVVKPDLAAYYVSNKIHELQNKRFVLSYHELEPSRQELFILISTPSYRLLRGRCGRVREPLRELAGKIGRSLSPGTFFLGLEDAERGLRTAATRSLEMELACHLADREIFYRPDLHSLVRSGILKVPELSDASSRRDFSLATGASYLLLGKLRGNQVSVELYSLSSGLLTKTVHVSLDLPVSDSMRAARHFTLSQDAIAGYDELVLRDLEDGLTETILAIHSGALDRAESQLLELEKRNPSASGRPLLVYSQGLIAEARGQENEAAKLYTQAYEQGLKDSEICRRLGELNLRRARRLYDEGHKSFWFDDGRALSQALELAELTADLANVPDAIKTEAEELAALCR